MANRISPDRVPSVYPDHGEVIPDGQVPIETADRFAALLATIRSTASSKDPANKQVLQVKSAKYFF